MKANPDWTRTVGGARALERLAERVAARPDFLAHALSLYQRLEGLPDTALATRLGLPVEHLTGLRLCRTPRGRAEVELIALHFGCDAAALVAVLGVD